MIYSNEHKEALRLQKEMNKIDKEHKKFVDDWTVKERSPDYSKKDEQLFKKKEEVFNEREDVAYEEYYNHMHKNLKIDDSYLNYKGKFTDTKYINDMFRKKAKEQQAKTTKQKKASTSKK